MTRPAAVLWDLDGTIVDTEPLWMAAEHDLAAQHGATWTEQDGLDLVGSELIAAARVIKGKLGSSWTPEEIVDWLVGRLATSLTDDQPWRPGAAELVRALADAGVPQALVTMSYRAIAEPVIEALPFDAVVTGDSVKRGKPHPEPYLAAAEILGVDPEQCIAVEDSITGATSANAAGCLVIVVQHMVEVPPAPRRIILDGLGGLGVDHLLTVWEQSA